MPRYLAIAALGALAACSGCTQRRGPPDAGVVVVPYGWLDGRPPEIDPMERPTAGGTLVVRLPDEPLGLNLLNDAHQGTWATRVARNLLYESLFEADPVTLKLKPALAEAVTMHPDARSFTFRLKPGRQFADGSPVTAADVLASIDAVKHPQRPTSAWRQRLAGLERWQATGPLEVEVSFAQPEAWAARSIATLPIYARASLEQDWAQLDVPIGSGPFVVTDWEPGQRLVLERSFLSATPAFLDRIIFKVVKDPVEARNQLQQGAFDLMIGVEPADWRDMEKPELRNVWAQQGYWRVRALENNFSFLAWNTRLPVLQADAARVAFAHVFPAKKIYEQVDHALELPTSCPYYAGGYGCVPELGVLNYDPKYARAVLADGGFVDSDGDGILELDGAPLKLSFVAPTRPPRLGQIAALYKEELRKIGAQVEVETVEPDAVAARARAGDFGVVGQERSSLDSELDLFPLLHSSEADGGSNVSGFAHPQLDLALEIIRLQPAAEKRHKLEQAVHEAVRKAQPILVFSTRPSLDMAKRRVRGLFPAPTWYDLRAVWLGRRDASADAGR